MGCRAFALLGCLWPRWCSGRRRARPPARLGDLTSFGAAPRSPPVPSGPSGALHTGGACGSGVPGQAPPPPTSTAARPSDPPAPSTPAALALRGVAWRVGSKPGQALPSLLAPRVKPSRPSMLSPRPISHVIPLRLFQILNSDRWNCNVFGLC